MPAAATALTSSSENSMGQDGRKGKRVLEFYSGIGGWAAALVGARGSMFEVMGWTHTCVCC